MEVGIQLAVPTGRPTDAFIRRRGVVIQMCRADEAAKRGVLLNFQGAFLCVPMFFHPYSSGSGASIVHYECQLCLRVCCQSERSADV